MNPFTKWTLASVVTLAGVGLASRAVNKQREPAPPPPPIVVPTGTVLHVRVDHTIGTATHGPGDRFSAKLISPVAIGEKVVLPAGIPVTGHVTYAKKSGRLRGRGAIAVTLDSFELNGIQHSISTGSASRVTGNHNRRNLALIGGGSGAGALIGGVAGGGAGALIGAGAGAGAGTAGAALTGKKNAYFTAESVLRFPLRAPVTLNPKDIPLPPKVPASTQS